MYVHVYTCKTLRALFPDQCNAVGKVDEMYTKLKGQLQEAKDHLQRAAGDLDQWQNITTDLFQQRTAGA